MVLRGPSGALQGACWQALFVPVGGPLEAFHGPSRRADDDIDFVVVVGRNYRNGGQHDGGYRCLPALLEMSPSNPKPHTEN